MDWEKEKNKILDMTKKEIKEDMMKAFKWLLQNNSLTMSERGSHITWNKPLVGQIIINKWDVWFAAVSRLSSVRHYALRLHH